MTTKGAGQGKPTIAELLAAKKKAPAKKQSGPRLTLRAEAESPVNPDPIPADRRRSLASTSGEALLVAPEDAMPRDLAWHSALQAFESELCLVQKGGWGWLGVMRADQPDQPILLLRLPLYVVPPIPRTPDVLEEEDDEIPY